LHAGSIRLAYKIGIPGMEKKRVLLVSQEMEPYLVLSDIGNIVKKIAPFVHDNGMEIRVLMPRFGVINERRNRLHEVVRLSGINIIIDDEDHPLIIKVASLPGARIQVYFLDNEDFFKRKQVFRDEQDQFFEDNPTRTVFFCKGVLETVKKFGWPPDIIHCHGWMTSLIPMYIKTVYAKDPVFAQTTTIYSAYNNGFEESFPESFLQKAAISPDLTQEDIEVLSGLNFMSLNKAGVKYADAIIWGSPEVQETDDLKSLADNKPMLAHQEGLDIATSYHEFYTKLLSE
jgi:starch synthase